MVGEECEDGPCEGERGDDEEDQDGGWGEGVCLGEAVDEPGEHAHRGDLVMLGQLGVVEAEVGEMDAYESDQLEDAVRHKEYSKEHAGQPVRADATCLELCC